MSSELSESIKENFGEKSNEDLAIIVKDNNLEEWSEDAIQIAKNILGERNVDIDKCYNNKIEFEQKREKLEKKSNEELILIVKDNNLDERSEDTIQITKAILQDRDIDLDNYDSKNEKKKEIEIRESKIELEKDERNTRRKIYEYKIVEQKAKSILTGNLKSDTLEKILNQHASEGWLLDKIVDSDTTSLFGGKDMFMIIFRREKVF
ncbi:MAG: DUF4177 domain-containing protein [Candidatus Aminicenantes bacterium]|nr:DUF4177 domain-containing protein [Candidatus Aminicenantes bacterium]